MLHPHVLTMPSLAAAQEDERAYFDSLQAAGAAPGLVVRRCGERGKGLFATRCGGCSRHGSLSAARHGR